MRHLLLFCLKIIKNTGVNCNVTYVLRDSWWWQLLLFHIIRATKRKEETQMDMITLSNVQKSYGSHQVLNDVSLNVRKGEIYGLIGKNGAGKTTIFKIILGLTEYEQGRLRIAGSKSERDLLQARRKIGFFIGKNFLDYLSAGENLEYYRRMKGIKDKSETERVLKLVGLQNANGKFSDFSMGMKQRLGIANAMLGNPEIVILDEPVNGLDPQGIADIRNLIVSLNKELGTTFIVSSHILGELEHTANRFGIIDGGRVLKEITHDDLKVRSSKIEISVDDYERAKKLLTDNHIKISKETSEYKSLEDYYFELVGGAIND